MAKPRSYYNDIMSAINDSNIKVINKVLDSGYDINLLYDGNPGNTFTILLSSARVALNHLSVVVTCNNNIETLKNIEQEAKGVLSENDMYSTMDNMTDPFPHLKRWCYIDYLDDISGRYNSNKELYRLLRAFNEESNKFKIKLLDALNVCCHLIKRGAIRENDKNFDLFMNNASDSLTRIIGLTFDEYLVKYNNGEVNIMSYDDDDDYEYYDDDELL